MGYKAFVMTAALSSLALVQPTTARADMGDVVKLGIAVGIGCAVTGKCGGNNNQRSGSRAPRQVNQTVLKDQQALNYFGYGAGTPDGVAGRNTRAAISRYQAYMGFPATGKLDPYQRQTLVGAYDWAQQGGNAIYPGIQGQELLRAYGSYARGGNYCAETGRCAGGFGATGGYAGNGAPAPGYPNNGNYPVDANYGQAPGNAPVPRTQVVTPQTPPTKDRLVASPPIGGIVLPEQTDSASLADHCMTVDMISSANGGPVASPGGITAASQALDEQFCAASDYAVSVTESILAGSGVSDDELAQTCGQLVAFMSDQIAALDSRPASDVAEATRQQVATATGGDARGVIETSQICLGYGYRTDDPEVVLASSLLLVGAGQQPYGEVLGHHLRGGFGAPANPERARGWYDTAFSALDGGAQPAFLPSQSMQRVAIMRAALDGGAAAATSLTGSSAPAAGGALPTFQINRN